MPRRKKYVFKINGYTPHTIPMERLALYLADLAKMVGEPDSVHFVDITEGSAKLAWTVDEPAENAIAVRLDEIARGEASVAHMEAYRSLNRHLREDKTDAEIRPADGDAIILPFPGITAPSPVEYSGVPKSGSIDGVVVRIGGTRKEIHVAIDTGSAVFSKCVASKAVAKALAGHMFDDELRLHGAGRWSRGVDGRWALQRFVITSFEVLDSSSIGEIFSDLRAIGQDAWNGDNLWANAMEMRGKPN